MNDKKSQKVKKKFYQRLINNSTVRAGKGFKPGLFIARVQHNEDCPVPDTQNMADCTCGEDLEERVVEFLPKD